MEIERDILHQQITYYRARAQEYDEAMYQVGRFAQGKESNQGPGELETAMRALQTMGPFADILELACGTGIWTKELLKIGRSITAIDASPEMLQINARKVADPRVRYQCADLFAWQPDQRYDLVFFAFWLCHVPPNQLDPFLDKVHRSLSPTGQLFIVDQYTPSREDTLTARNDIYSTRLLHDSRAYTIVKVFYDLTALQHKLTQLGFTVTIHKTGKYFYTLSGCL